MAILTVPISPTLSTYTRFYELRNANGLQKIYTSFCVIMRPVRVPQATASRIEMKLAVKVSQYLFSPVKVVHLEYLV